ncbi:hypothetical protein [Marinomonas sp. S3726]|uniref:hypothetical protein n=1 Tax=Marinomonas sp. S3726 TaxID=579484 RepID=UPI0005FA4144|nr:hypothetical protein [Marinomonas sp. S3726]
MDTSKFSVSTNLKQQRKQKGRNLARHDRDVKMINSGSLGPKRLVMNIAIDLQEMCPELSDQDAQKMALGYCILNYGTN